MRIDSTAIEGVWTIQNKKHSDQRGNFQEWFQSKKFYKGTGIQFTPQQANSSVSKKGVIRGIHYSKSKEGQAKLVTCMSGEILDVIFDLRSESETFGHSVSLAMEGGDGKSIYIPEGMGHAFISLKDNSNLVYLLSSIYEPTLEDTVHPLDTTLGFKWPLEEIILSDRDALAPSLVEQIRAKNLPGMN